MEVVLSAAIQGMTGHRILIVGGGCAGITTAATLRKHDPSLEIAIIEPSDLHWYQPGLTLVGAGIFTRQQTERREETLIPNGVRWIKKAVVEFLPDQNAVRLDDKSLESYDVLVACPGLKLAWDKVEGLTESLGRNGVCSNYLPKYAEYTWNSIKAFRGGTALFTQPPMPIKCAGAPQKIMYLMADHLRSQGNLDQATIEFCLAGDAMFAVPFFVPPLLNAVKDYGINVRYKHNLKAVDGAAKRAVFTVTDNAGTISEIEKSFDLLHVTPPQIGLDFVRSSPLANAAGWIEVDQGTLQHSRYDNIFGLGDATSTPNAKTAAAVRMQAPVVVKNLLAVLKGQKPEAIYDGYGSCPLTVANGKIVLAEFAYGGKITPSFPLDPRVPRRSMWYLKTKFLPWLYWNHMFSGGEFDIPHKERSFPKAA
jgi:sulfide:quinone oxidoreductase